MLPWEHLAVGYLLYSAWSHLREGRRPSGRLVVAVAVATQLPDLVDKPLAWEFGLLPGGQTLGHSIAFALPAVAFVFGAFGRRSAVAFGIGYLSHLAGDVMYPVVLGGSPRVSFLLWPFVESGGGESPGFLSETRDILGDAWQFMMSPEGTVYLTAELALLLAVFSLWLYDGRPGVPRRSRRARIGRRGDS
jgi:hypothetical protein